MGVDADKILFSDPEQYRRARVVKTLLNHHALALLPKEVDPCKRRDRECRQSQRQGKGTVNKIDHPPGGSKDPYDAEAIAIWLPANHACANIEFRP